MHKRTSIVALGLRCVAGLVLCLSLSLVCAAEDGKLFNMTFPDFSTLGKVSIPRIRISGKVSGPGTQVFVNDQESTVYASGAFIAMIELEAGDNLITVRAVKGESVQEKVFTVSRSAQQMVSCDPEPLVIEKFISPSSDCLLMPSDSLRVTVKGTPECKASFRLAQEDGWRDMTESEFYSGVAGVYSGLLKIPEGLDSDRDGLTCMLENSKGETVTAECPSSVKVMTGDKVMVCRTLEDARVRTSYNGTFLALLPEDIDLSIIGKRGGRYRVAFCDGQSGWIDVKDVKTLPAGHEPASSLVQKINYSSQPEGGIFSIPLDARVPYDVFYSVSDSKIVLRLFNCFSKLNWIDIPTDETLVRGVEWRQNGEICEIIFNLNEQLCGYDVSYRGSRLDFSLFSRRPKGPYTIVLDPGHGGYDSGAIGPAGTFEKDGVLKLCSKLAEILRARGYNVVLTRADDKFIELKDRPEIALSNKGDLFVSVHMNAVGMSVNPLKSSGYHVFFTRPLSLDAARRVHAAIGSSGLADNGIVCADFHVTRQTYMPSILIETCFLTNPLDEVLVLDGDFYGKVASSIADGVDACFKAEK